MTMRGLAALVVAGVLALPAVPVLAQPYAVPGAGRPLSIEQAEQIARQVLVQGRYTGLELDEIQEFTNNFYVAVRYTTGGRGAFELLIDRYTGRVHPEPPVMMWNTQFGHTALSGGYGPGMMSGGAGFGYGPGMMGGRGPGMMGGGYGGRPAGPQTPGASPWSAPAATPSVTASQARTIAQTFLDAQFPGTKVRNVDPFPGYYTVDVTRGGKVVAMLSVNAYTGQVWYHSWHGAFVASTEA